MKLQSMETIGIVHGALSVGSCFTWENAVNGDKRKTDFSILSSFSHFRFFFYSYLKVCLDWWCVCMLQINYFCKYLCRSN